MRSMVAMLAAILPGLAAAQPSISGCPVFPANNIWNARVDTLPLHPSSDKFIASIGAASRLRYDAVMPINVVPGDQAPVAIQFQEAADNSDPGPYPVPPGAGLEAGNDAHLLVIDRDNCILYEAYSAARQSDGSWNAYSGAKWDLRSNALRPDGWTSADAAGLAVAAGLLRYDEVAGGKIAHAIRFTAPKSRNEYIWPARHYASSSSDPNLPLFGLRFRLKSSFDASGLSAANRVIVDALKTYGIMLADNGLAWEMQFASDSRWNEDDLLVLMNAIHGSDFEAVDTSSLMADVNSGRAGKVKMGIPIALTDAVGRSVQEIAELGPGVTYANGVLSASGGAAAVTSVAGRSGDVTLGIPDITGLQAALDAKQNVTQAANGRGPGSAAGLLRSSSGSAAFVKADTSTYGSWRNVYGAEGFNIVGDAAECPRYATVATAGQSLLQWTASTFDARALRKAHGADYLAAAWQSPTSFTVDVNLNDGAHQVALYFVDWDNTGRAQHVEVLDLNQNVLDARDVASFHSGTYLAWRLSGHVIFRITNTSPQTTAVVSGIFFDK